MISHESSPRGSTDTMEHTEPLIPSPQHTILMGDPSLVDFSRPEFNLSDKDLEDLGQRIDEISLIYEKMKPSEEKEALWYHRELLMFAYLWGQRGRHDHLSDTAA